MQGRSLLPLLNGKTKDWQEEAYVQISEVEMGRAIRTRRWKYGVVAPDKNPWKDATSDRYVEAYLYDLESDPYEFNNLAGRKTHREIARGLKKKLLCRIKEAGEPDVVIVDASSPV
jgi:arylsulfatase A-like enzyme